MVMHGLPAEFEGAPSVVMNPPPAQYMDETIKIVTDATSHLPPDKKASLFWVASMVEGRANVNLAFVERVNDNVAITAWVGKEWGKPVAAGVAVQISW